MIIQIIIVLFVLFAISRAILRFKEHSISIMELLIWIVVWCAMAVATILPHTTAILAKILGVGRGVDAVLYLAILVLFYALFRLIIKTQHIENEITSIVRSLALREKKRIRTNEDRFDK